MTFPDSDDLRRLTEELYAHNLSRRQVLKRAMAIGLSASVIAALLAACGSDGDEDANTPEGEPAGTTIPAGNDEVGPVETEGPAPTEDTSASTNTVTTGESQTAGGGGGPLTILLWQAPTNLNPHFGLGGKDFEACRICFEPLVDFDDAGNPLPFLAAEIPSLENGAIAPDGMSVTWKLREGVTWHDGEPFTSADVKFTWECVIHPDTPAQTKAVFQAMESIETPDDLTVIVHYTSPNPAWCEGFSGVNGLMVPQHILKDWMGAQAGDAPFNLAPIGTGPFRVVDFRAGDAILYERYEDYWDAGKPFFDTVTLKGGGDAKSAARAVLQTGEADWAWNFQVEAEVLDQMTTGSMTGQIVASVGSSVGKISVNFSDPDTEAEDQRSYYQVPHPFLSEPSARQALALAVDRDSIAGVLYGVPAGQQRTCSQPLNALPRRTLRMNLTSRKPPPC